MFPASRLAFLVTLLLAASASAELRAMEARVSLVLPLLGERELGTGSGVAEVAASTPGLPSLTFGANVSGSTSIPVTDPGAAPVTSLRVTAQLQGGAVQIDPWAGPFGGPAVTQQAIALPGHVRLCMLLAPLPPCLGGVSIPFSDASDAGLGIGGVVTVGGTATLRISLYGAPFTLNAASVRATTESGAVATLVSTGSLHGPLSFTSTAGLTVGGVGGRLGLVTPVRVVTSQAIGSANALPGFLRLELQLLPEPGRAVAFVAGALLLAGLGLWRRFDPTPRKT